MKIDLKNLTEEKNNLEKENSGLKVQLKVLNVEKVKCNLEKEKKEQELNLLRDKYSNEVENRNSIIEGYKNEIDKLKLTNDENLKEKKCAS